MTRALSSSWAWLVVLALLGLVMSPAVAAPKQSVAILGLEVIDTSGSVDPEAVKVAKELTDGLRARAKVGSGPYVLAPGSDKELIDEKLIKNCDNEALSCMAQIGKELGANYLMYGRLEKKGDGYQVQINLLNIDKKKFEKTKLPLTIPLSQKDSASLAAAAKRAYNDLTGVTEAGSLVVTANVDSGEVFLDEVSRGQLVNGSLTIDKLAEGRYRLAIESRDHKRYETIVTIRSGESIPQNAQLEKATVVEIGGTTSQAKRSGAWVPLAVTGGLLTAGAAGVWIYGYSKTQVTKAESDQIVADTGLPPDADHEQMCTDQYRKASKLVDDGCTGRTLTWVGGVGVGVFGVATAFFLYKAMSGGSEESLPAPTPTTGRRTKKRDPVTVTPVMLPDGGGVTLQLDW